VQQQVLSASRPELIEPFTGLAPRTFRRLVAQVERRGGRQVADRVNGRQWSLPLADRVLLVATYYRTNLTMRQLAPLFGVKTAAVHRIIDRLGPFLALAPARRKYGPDTVLIVDGTLVPTRDGSVAYIEPAGAGSGPD
jgi:Helix-turn-helix of DDE superfamily endonuclease